MSATEPASQAASPERSVPVLPAAPPKRADARRNYDRLLSAAAAVFAERGADDVSLEEIARRAGVGIGTLYRHFPARQALLEAVYKDQVDGLEVLAGKLLASESPGAALSEWMRAFVAFGRTKRSLSSALVATIGKDSELMSACSMILKGCTETLLSRAQETGEARPEVQSADIMRLAHALIVATEMAPADPDQPERLASLIVGSVLLPEAART
ncbi:MAG TPA: helix-turn-helix domain-containing protein [Streptosporangiaceae bacterium]|nr:helix-turn-helix domain-containing protein [Streptosporangiaceae bacterium]